MYPTTRVDFHGQPLIIVIIEGKCFVAMKPIVKGMGLNWRSQQAKFALHRPSDFARTLDYPYKEVPPYVNKAPSIDVKAPYIDIKAVKVPSIGVKVPYIYVKGIRITRNRDWSMRINSRRPSVPPYNSSYQRNPPRTICE